MAKLLALYFPPVRDSRNASFYSARLSVCLFQSDVPNVVL
jgi:hypothetical protein